MQVLKNELKTLKKKASAIELGKKSNVAKRAYENDKLNKILKKQYKQANKEYKKALRKNTTYRKGQIKNQVGKDLSRKYLSDAKKIKKQLDVEPSNKQLQKEYNKLMSQHDVVRAKARRAPEVAANRSAKKAAMKRAMTMTVKSAVASAAVIGGAYAVSRYSNGKISSQQFSNSVEYGRKIMSGLNEFRRFV